MPTFCPIIECVSEGMDFGTSTDLFLMAPTVSKRIPSISILSLRSGKKSHGAKSGEHLLNAWSEIHEKRVLDVLWKSAFLAKFSVPASMRDISCERKYQSECVQGIQEGHLVGLHCLTVPAESSWIHLVYCVCLLRTHIRSYWFKWN